MRTIFLVMLVFSLRSQVPTVGLTGGWPFNGNANDMSGAGNHGTVNNATLIADRFGNPNSAYDFNGYSSSIVMLSAGPTGSVSRSVSFWFKSTGTQIGVAFGYGAASPGGIFQILFNYTCQGLGFDNSQEAYIKGGSSVNNSQWQHAVVIYDATLGNKIGNISYFVNGQLLTNFNCKTSGTLTTVNSNATHPIAIGMTADSQIRHFKGGLDDFYMYNRALTTNEVLQLYNNGCPVPAAPVAIIGNTNICAGSAQIFSVASNSAATSYVWNLPGGWSGTSTTNVISVMPSSSGVISVAAVNNCGQSAWVTRSVSIKPLPVMSISAQSVVTPCGQVSATLSATGASTYSWSNGSQNSTVILMVNATSIYTVTGQDVYGCNGKSTYGIFVASTPSPVLSVSGPGPSCPGATVSLASQGASNYTWQPGNLNGFYVSVTPTITTTYTVTGKDQQTGCVNTYTHTHVVLQGAAVNVLATSTVLCENQTATLSASGASSYYWLPLNVSTSSVVINPAVTTSYSISGSSTNGCNSLPAVVTISVKPMPSFAVTAGQNPACFGQQINLGANGANSYTWQPGNLTGFLISVTPSTTTTYTVTGENGNGCKKLMYYTQEIQDCSRIGELNTPGKVLVYPNPCSVSLVVITNGYAKIKVTDILGRVLIVREIEDSVELDVTSLNAGAYYLNISHGPDESTRKIIKL